MKKLKCGIAVFCAVITLVLAGCDNPLVSGEDLGLGQTGTGKNIQTKAVMPGTSSGAFTASVSFANKDKGTITFVSGSESFTATWSKPFYSKRMDLTFNLPANITLASSGHGYTGTAVGDVQLDKQPLRVYGGNRAYIANIDPKTWKFTISLACSVTTDFTASMSFANKDKGTITFASGQGSFTATWSKPFYSKRMDLTFNLPANITLASSGHGYTGTAVGNVQLDKQPLRVYGGNRAYIANIDPKTWKFTISLACTTAAE